VTYDPDFKVTTFCDFEYQKTTARLKDKITIAQEESMVVCLVTLTDL